LESTPDPDPDPKIMTKADPDLTNLHDAVTALTTTIYLSQRGN
jgi:hypothetical protein